jgi:hypothetical protein
MLAIRAYLLVDLLGQRGGYARFIFPGSWDATARGSLTRIAIKYRFQHFLSGERARVG